jgi:hypothetical protein
MSNFGKFVSFDAAVSLEKAETFGLNNKNREYNHSHLNKIKREMVACLDVMPPLTVNVVTNHIVDGQHRHKGFIDLRKAGLLPVNSTIKVMYVSIPEDKEYEAIVRANNNSKGWTLENYVASNITKGIVSYVNLDSWCKTHTLASDESGKPKYRYGSAIIKGQRVNNDLKHGTLTISNEELERADAVHNELLKIMEILDMPKKGLEIEALAISWIEVRDQHDFNTWVKSIKSKKSDILKMPKKNSKQWIAIFAYVHLDIEHKMKKENK